MCHRVASIPSKKGGLSMDSRVVKGDGLKIRCRGFVGSNPTPCKIFHTFLRVFLNNIRKLITITVLLYSSCNS